METYRFYPPQMRPTRMAYHVVAPGTARCQHELLDEPWCDRISVRDGVVFVTFSCKRCGRKICQSLDEVLPPATWKGEGKNDKMVSTQEKQQHAVF